MVRTITLIMALSLAAASFAISPVSYDMFNGDGVSTGGSFNYWDLKYNGSGSTNVDRAFLLGGTGDLTDGVVSNLNWNLAENLAGTGPFVGWRDYDPIINFGFAAATAITTMSFHFDDSDGNGGVSAPLKVRIEGDTFDVADPSGAAPFWFTVSGLSLNTQNVEVQLYRGNQWIFVDEITFNPVPEPSTWLAIGIGGIAFVARRRRRVG